MDINWFPLFIAWLGGVGSGLLANWLFHRYARWRKRKGVYLATTMSTDAIEFEGRVWHNTAMLATMQEMERQVLGVSTPLPLPKSQKGK